MGVNGNQPEIHCWQVPNEESFQVICQQSLNKCHFYDLPLSLENVFVIPHGDEIIDHPNRESIELSERIRKVTSRDLSDTIVIISPHGLKLSNSIGVINTQYLNGQLSLKTRRINRKYETDRILATAIAASGPLTQEVSFVTSTGPMSVFPLDFGSVIPLTFFRKKRLVSIGQPRIWDLDGLMDFGKALAGIAERHEKKVTIVISADQAHTHAPDGVYGFALEAKPYEDLIEKCVVASDMTPLLELNRAFIEKAKPDSYWNMIILKGIMDHTGMKSVLDYHYVEHYFGMLLAHLIK